MQDKLKLNQSLKKCFNPHLPGDGSGLPPPQPMICWFWYKTCGDAEFDGGDDEEVDGDDDDGHHLAWPE